MKEPRIPFTLASERKPLKPPRKKKMLIVQSVILRCPDQHSSEGSLA